MTKTAAFILAVILPAAALPAAERSNADTEAPRAFQGRWITSAEFADVEPVNVFHRQYDFESGKKVLENSKPLQNRHMLFRGEFFLDELPQSARLFFSADDYAKVYINGKFAAQGPAPGYFFHYLYCEADASKFLRKGRNVVAIHGYYQGLINRVWVSGDLRSGVICDLLCDGKTVLKTGESWKCAPHTGISSAGKAGYDTQFLENYDAGAPETGFELPGFDDSKWRAASLLKNPQYKLFPSPLPPLKFEEIAPAETRRTGANKIFVDFGAMYAGYFSMSAEGKKSDKIELRFGQELNPDGSVRYKLRANCDYREHFILSGKGADELRQFDYKPFRYAEIILPESGGAKVDEGSIRLIARHMPFKLAAKNRYAGDARARKVWDLCVRTLRYGAQEQILDCMEREKGYYLGDGCYSVLAWCLLNGDFAPMRKFVDDFLRTSFINGGLVTCANCSFMQEIAEYPLMMFILLPVLEGRDDGREFVRERLGEFRKILDFYAENYAEADGLLSNLDKWCVVEWPHQWRDGYDVDIKEGEICKTKHNVINAWYVGAVRAFNRTARRLGEREYEGESRLVEAFRRAFYDPQKKLFRDSVESARTSYPSNIYAWFLGLYPDGECRAEIIKMIRQKRLDKGMLFISFPLLAGLQRDGEEELLLSLITDKKAWLRMIEEGASATYEGWGKDAKWNTSLFHLTLSSCAALMVEGYDIGKVIDLR